MRKAKPQTGLHDSVLIQECLSLGRRDLPEGCHIVLSSIDLAVEGSKSKSVMVSAEEGVEGGGGSRQACQDILRAVERNTWGEGGIQIVKLGDMTREQREEMLLQMVSAGVASDRGQGQSADDLGKVVRERSRKIMQAEHGESPLYLRLASEDIVRALTGQQSMGDDMPGLIPQVFDRLLKELEEGFSTRPRILLESVFCTQGGMLPPQLLQVLVGLAITRLLKP